MIFITTLRRGDHYVPTGIYDPVSTRDFIVKANINNEIAKYPVSKIAGSDKYVIVDNLGIYCILKGYDPKAKFYVFNHTSTRYKIDVNTNRTVLPFGNRGRIPIKPVNQNILDTSPIYISFNDNGSPIELSNTFNEPFMVNPTSLNVITMESLNYHRLFFKEKAHFLTSEEQVKYAELVEPVFMDLEPDTIEGYFISLQSYEAAYPLLYTGSWIYTLYGAESTRMPSECIVPASDGLFIHKGQRVNYLGYNQLLQGFVPIKQVSSARLNSLELEPICPPCIDLPNFQSCIKYSEYPEVMPIVKPSKLNKLLFWLLIILILAAVWIKFLGGAKFLEKLLKG